MSSLVAVTRQQVVDLLRTKRGRDETSAQMAERIGISPQFLSDIWQGRRDPGFRVLKFLGLRKGYEVEKPKGAK